MTSLGEFSSASLPPVCGFNLLEKFSWRQDQPRGRRFSEWDFDFMAEHGFRFARLPMDYRVWTRDLDGPRRDVDASVLDEVVEAVEMGRARGIHVCINIHRGPGYCINHPEIEPFNLWTDTEAQDCFGHHWQTLAERFGEYPNAECSFDLLNEPPGYGQRGFEPEVHRKVMQLAADAIREVSPERLIICDGHGGGNYASGELLGLDVAQSTRGYIPHTVTHYQAHWISRSTPWAEPEWPMPDEKGGRPWDRARLDEEIYQPWRDLQRRGVGVHCGEMGVYNRTPADVAYRFIDDVLSIFDENGWGWAFWNLRGAFGVLDNGRQGAATESCGDHQLDRRMLELLKQHLPGNG